MGPRQRLGALSIGNQKSGAPPNLPHPRATHLNPSLRSHDLVGSTGVMEMADGNCDGVGGIEGSGGGWKRKQDANHLLNLMLLGITVSHDSLLHQSWRIFKYL
jgi:hypothetical protein